MDISSYVAQHRETETLVRKLQTLIQNGPAAIPDIIGLLTQLSGKLKFHLSMEDKFVYPRAATSPDADLQAAAQKMQAEMAGIAAAFGTYASTWNSVTIARNFTGFITETNGIATTIKKRIDTEEKIFYPLVHKHL